MPYIPHTKEEIEEMLKIIGALSIDDLFSHIPKKFREEGRLNIPPPMTEPDVLNHLKNLAQKNQCGDEVSSFLGGGAYRHRIPTAVTELAGRSEFLTPYTPYQPEIAQGTLQATFEYQSMICRIFGMEISNASLYDGSTAIGEAALMALRIGKHRKTIAVCETLHPEYREVLHTLLANNHAHLVSLPCEGGRFNRSALRQYLHDDLAAVIVQFPNFFGIVEEYEEIAQQVHDAGGLLISATPEPISLGLFAPPAEWGADIAVGEGLSFGIPTTFGGPALGIFTTRESFLRQMPGRVCGETVDVQGRRSYTLTLSTREQHIRREKATSNICTNQAHCATTAAIYLALIGKEGFSELSQINASKAHYARDRLCSISGVRQQFDAPFFNEFVIELPKPASKILVELRRDNIHGGVDLGRWYANMKNSLLVCCTERNKKEEIDQFAARLGDIVKGS